MKIQVEQDRCVTAVLAQPGLKPLLSRAGPGDPCEAVCVEIRWRRDSVDACMHPPKRNAKPPNTPWPLSQLLQNGAACAPRQQNRGRALPHTLAFDPWHWNPATSSCVHGDDFSARCNRLLGPKNAQRKGNAGALDPPHRRVSSAAEPRNHSGVRSVERGQHRQRIDLSTGCHRC
jgi:hypothetical protein